MKISKMKNKELLIWGLSIFVTLIFMQSCVKEDALTLKSLPVQNDFELLAQSSKKTWKEQLEFIKSNELSILKQNDIQLLEYDSVSKISQNRVESIAAEFTNENNYIPDQKAGSNKINVIRLSEFIRKKSPGVTITSNKQTEYFKELIGKSSGIIRLKWRVGNDVIITNCLVSDDKGIVFDNILTNIRVTKEEKVVKIDTLYTPHTKAPKSKLFKVATEDIYRITNYLTKTWTTYHSSRNLYGHTGEAQYSWGVAYIEVTQYGSIIYKEIQGPSNCGGYAYLEGGQAQCQVSSGQWDNQRAMFYYGFWFSLDETITMTLQSNTGYVFGSSFNFAGSEFGAGEKWVYLSDI